MHLSIESVNSEAAKASILPDHVLLIRQVGKLDRLALTGAIKLFTEYSDHTGQVSTRPEWAYKNVTAAIYKVFGLNVKLRDAQLEGVTPRDNFDETELTFLQTAERSAAHVLLAGMNNGLTRQEIKESLRETIYRIANIYKNLPGIREAA